MPSDRDRTVDVVICMRLAKSLLPSSTPGPYAVPVRSLLDRTAQNSPLPTADNDHLLMPCRGTGAGRFVPMGIFALP